MHLVFLADIVKTKMLENADSTLTGVVRDSVFVPDINSGLLGDIMPNWVFVVFLAIVIILLLYVVFKTGQLKISILEKRKSKLETLVNERTSDLLNEKDKFERLLLESERAKDDLKRANKIKTKLINVAVHDLKSPLQSILGFQELLKEKVDNDEEALEMIGTIFRSSQKMLNIVNETLAAASAELNEMVIKKSVYNVSEIVKEVVNPNKVRANQKLQVIHMNLDKSIYAEFDRELICRALDNLVSNAIKYSEFNRNIWVDAYKENKSIKITVADEGPGISSEGKTKLFKEFQTIGSVPTGGETSSGYGLFLAKDIVIKHGGDIKVESEIGSGSKFIVELPL